MPSVEKGTYTISDIEKEIITISRRKLKKILDYFNIPIEESTNDYVLLKAGYNPLCIEVFNTRTNKLYCASIAPGNELLSGFSTTIIKKLVTTYPNGHKRISYYFMDRKDPIIEEFKVYNRDYVFNVSLEKRENVQNGCETTVTIDLAKDGTNEKTSSIFNKSYTMNKNEDAIKYSAIHSHANDVDGNAMRDEFDLTEGTSHLKRITNHLQHRLLLDDAYIVDDITGNYDSFIEYVYSKLKNSADISRDQLLSLIPRTSTTGMLFRGAGNNGKYAVLIVKILDDYKIVEFNLETLFSYRIFEEKLPRNDCSKGQEISDLIEILFANISQSKSCQIAYELRRLSRQCNVDDSIKPIDPINLIDDDFEQIISQISCEDQLFVLINDMLSDFFDKQIINNGDLLMGNQSGLIKK